jgi:Zn-dependent peptidase ImmA (M78 family)
MARPRFRRGFKSQAESLSLEIRTELGLRADEPFYPSALAEHLAVEVVGLSELAAHGARAESISHFRRVAKGEFSAVTVFNGKHRIIIVNDAHAAVRQASSLSHELSHLVLEHDPHPAIGDGGCRLWSNTMEAEADWMAGTLLVPRDAALKIARDSARVDAAAAEFGVSEQMMRWRLANTGALLQARRERARRAWTR